MAHRNWKVCENMGYAGTDTCEEVDIVEWLGLTVEEAEEMTDDEAEDRLCKYQWEDAVQKVDVWAEKI